MTSIAIAELPSFQGGRAVGLKLAPTRRSVLKGILGTGMLTGLSFVSLVGRATPAGAAPYYKEWTGTTTGPCTAGTGYARNHTEEGKRCGPSLPCSPQGSCCHTGSSTVSGEAQHNTGNKQGWHRYGSITNGSYLQRPDECVTGGYDSWRWNFNGTVYGCSDGWSCSSTSCTRTICPYAR